VMVGRVEPAAGVKGCGIAEVVPWPVGVSAGAEAEASVIVL